MAKAKFISAVSKFCRGMGIKEPCSVHAEDGNLIAASSGYKFVGNSRGFSVRKPYDSINGYVWITIGGIA